MNVPEPWFAEIVELQKQDQIEAALERIEGVLGQSPDSAPAFFLRGCLHCAQENVPAAVADWQAAAALEPDIAERLSQEQTALVEGALYNLGVEEQVSQDEPDTLAALADAYRWFGRMPEALRCLQRVVEVNPRAHAVGAQAAELLIAQGQTEPALQLLQKLLEFREDSAELHYQIGFLNQQQGATAQALKHLERAVAIDAGYVPPRLLLGEIYTRQGRFEQGEIQLQKALESQPEARAYIALSECVRGQYRFEEGLDHLKKAVEVEPGNARAWTELGSLALQFGDLGLGVDSLKKALEIQPDQDEVFPLLARAAQQRGDLPEAVSAYRRWLAVTPGDAGAWHSLGNLLRQQGAWEDARLALESARQILDRDPQICLDLAECLVQLGQEGDATFLLRSAYLRNPNHNEIRHALQQLDPDVLSEETSSVPTSATLPPVPEVEQENPWLVGFDLDQLNTSLGQHEPEASESEQADPVAAEPASVAEAPVASVEASPESALAEAKSLLDSGDLEGGIGRYKSVLEREPKNFTALQQLGLLSQQLGRHFSAGDYLRRAFALNPSEFSLVAPLVQTLTQLEEHDRDEVLAGIILAIPAQFDRKQFLQELWSLRGSADVDELVDVIVQGVFSRFPSDQACREYWKQLLEPPAPQVEEMPTEIAAAEPEIELEPVSAEADEPSSAEVEAPEVEEIPEVAAELEVSPGEADALVEPDQATVEPEPIVSEPEIASEAVVSSLWIDPEPVVAEPVSVEEPVTEPEPEADLLELAVMATPEPLVASAPNEATELAPLGAPDLSSPQVFVPDDLPTPVAPQELVEPAVEAVQPEAPSVEWLVENQLHVGVDSLQGFLGLVVPAAGRELADCYRQVAVLAHEGGLLDQAISVMAQALYLEPERGGAWLLDRLSEVVVQSREQGNSERALSYCRVWLNINPEDPRLLEALEQLDPSLLPAPKFVVPDDLTMTTALPLLQEHPDHPELLQRLLAMVKENEEEALTFYRALTKTDTQEPLHVRNFAKIYLQLEKPLLAAVQYQKYLMAAPSADGYRELATIYTLLNREKNASEALRKAEELSAS